MAAPTPVYRVAAKEEEFVSRAYREPPVVEALAEVFFEGSDWDLAAPGLFYEMVREDFPQRGQVGQLSMTVELGADAGRARVQPGEPRAQFRTDDGSRIVQVGRDVLVVNQLRPYPRFEDWRPDVLEMLERYVGVANPSTCAKLGLRYINKITLPTAEVQLQDYFHLYPETPDEIGTPFGPFVFKVESRPPKHTEHILVSTFGTSQTEEGAPALLLDFYDVLAQRLPAERAAVAGFLDEAHDNVEAAFESSITDRSRALFKEVSHAQPTG